MAGITDEEREARIARLVQAAIDVPRLTLPKISALTGISVSYLEKFRLLERPAPPAARLRLALALERQAQELLRIARRLRASAAPPRTPRAP